MKYTFVFLLLFGWFLAGCQKEDMVDNKNLKSFTFQKFTLMAPANWKAFTQVGIDSQVGGITNGLDTLFYDYGWYSYNLSKETAATHYRQSRILDNRQALLVVPKVQGAGLIGAYLEVDQMYKLGLYSRSSSEDIIVKIIESVKFK